MTDDFDAYLIDRDAGTKNASGAWSKVRPDQMMEGEVTLKVTHTTMNYKDALAVSGEAPIARRFPMVPGIDLAGEVTASTSPDFAEGDTVFAMGWGLGETHWGGYATYARLPADWLMKMPQGLGPAEVMSIGTAGYTAALCVLRLEAAGVPPQDRPILVTGASGGVGSFAVHLLSRAGHRVAAATGRPEESDYLTTLGATEIVDRDTLSGEGRPLGKDLYAGAIDAVGSRTLANVLSQTAYGGTVAACGLAQGSDLPATVLPFILRGVTLAGVDSVMAPMDLRRRAWDLITQRLDTDRLGEMTQTAALKEIEDLAPRLLDGKIRGRILIDAT